MANPPQNLRVQPGLNGAFMAEGFGQKLQVTPRSGVLQGLRLAVKDVFAVQGLRTSAGNPAWWAQQTPAACSADAVQWLLEAGASWVGKTVTDELAYSLTGINNHLGTPLNPADPARIPGGSSSGSVVAVAAGLADIGLASDCGGSARLPASYCGVYGFRPTQDLVSKNGAFTLAHSFDTVGWFTRDADTLTQVFAVLTHSVVPPPAPADAWRLPADFVDVCDTPVRAAFGALRGWLSGKGDVQVMPLGTLAPQDWAQAHRTLQGAEIWQQHGPWVKAYGDSLAPDVHQRFTLAADVTAEQVAQAQPVRAAATRVLARSLDREGALLVLPTAPGIAPRIDAPGQALDTARSRAQQLLCAAGLAGLPQVTLPWTQVDGAPVGLSLVGARGADQRVLAAARWWAEQGVKEAESMTHSISTSIDK